MRVVAKNKKAYHEYEILETYEAGIALMGSEVKSVREGRISLKESYAEIKGGELYLVNCHISPYMEANIFNHHPRRERKLLLHRREIKRLTGKIKERGLTLIPLRTFINDRGLVKMEMGLGKGKKIYEKREVIRERDREREMKRELKRWKR